jgi:hypothetical protein
MMDISLEVITAGCVAGGIFGCFLISDSERQYRSLDRNNMGIIRRTLTSELTLLFLAVILMPIVIVPILTLSDAYPLKQFDRYVFLSFWIAFLILARKLRYLIWVKSK